MSYRRTGSSRNKPLDAVVSSGRYFRGMYVIAHIVIVLCVSVLVSMCVAPFIGFNQLPKEGDE